MQICLTIAGKSVYYCRRQKSSVCFLLGQTLINFDKMMTRDMGRGNGCPYLFMLPRIQYYVVLVNGPQVRLTGVVVAGCSL